MGDLVKIIVATGIEWLPKVRKIAQSGHTGYCYSFIALLYHYILAAAFFVWTVTIETLFAPICLFWFMLFFLFFLTLCTEWQDWAILKRLGDKK